MTRLVDAGIVAPEWNADPNKGIVTDSVVGLRGPPRQPQGHQDLGRPDPRRRRRSSRPTRHVGRRPLEHPRRLRRPVLKEGKTEEEAIAYLTELFEHIVVQDKSARDALNTFLAGQGDVLLSYENEAITAQLAQQPVDYVVPDDTILIENPAAVTLNGDAAVPAKAFLDYVLSPEGQAIFGDLGYRPVDARGARHVPATSRRRQACSPSMTSVAGPRSPRSSSTRTPASSPRSTARSPDRCR